jgi:hypothetical protein
VGALLGSLRSSGSLWRAGHLQADLSCHGNVFLRHIGAAGFEVKRVGVRSAVWRFGIQLLPPEPVGEMQR